MNLFLPSRFDEIVHRLALGIEPMDAMHDARLRYQLQAVYDNAQQSGPLLDRHASNLFALRYQKGVKTSLDLRFFDATERNYHPSRDRRRVVPRRLRIPILSLSDVEAQEQIDQKGFARRIRRPFFFPGAAYSFEPTATALRATLLRNNKPLRWARVEARIPSKAPVIGRAHSDDRGEFLLLIAIRAAEFKALGLDPVLIGADENKPHEVDLEIKIFGPAAPLIPNPIDLPTRDPLWDLPLETLSAPGTDDPVATGLTLPSGYVELASPTVKFTIGRSTETTFVIA